MDEKVWTVEELKRMTAAEQDAIFEASLVNDLDRVPPEFLARVRNRAQKRIEDAASHRP